MSLLLIALLAAEVTPPPTHAEVCYARSMILIEDAMAETGRVAGPSWFIRDWWDEQLTDAQRDDARLAAVQAHVRARMAEDPAAADEEGQGCVDEAVKAGAVPGWE
ncbi:MAG TPA: hypothetical protein VGE54_08645 [Brevundimonas sp.]